jgi:FdhD protein
MAPQFRLPCANLALIWTWPSAFTEAIIDDVGQILSMNAEPEEDSSGKSSNRVTISLRPEVAIDPSRIRRNFYTSSSGGVCGRLAIGAIEIRPPRPMRQFGPQFRADVIYRLPGLLRQAQNAFDRTGGIHRGASRPKVFCSVCVKTSDDTTRSTN